MNKNKYGARRMWFDGNVFDSAAEKDRYIELKLLERAGQISKLALQPAFNIIQPQPGEKGAKYTADFMYMENGKIIVEDVKSEITVKKPDYVLRRKLFKLKYPDYVFRETII